MLCRAIYDVIFASHFIALYLVSSKSFVEQDPVTGCWVRNSSCTWMAAVFQYSYFGSIAYYAVLTFDLYLALTNPFVDSQTYLAKYHIGSIGVTSLSTAVLLYVPSPSICFCLPVCISINASNC